MRLFTLENLEEANSYHVPSVLTTIEQMAAKDPDKKVQAKALELLAKLADNKYQPLFEKYINDSSYSVSGAALQGLTTLEPSKAYTLAKKYSNDALGKLGEVVAEIISKNGSEDDFNILLSQFKNEPFSENKIKSAFTFARYLLKIKNTDNIRKGVDEIMKVRNQVPDQYKEFIDPGFKQAFTMMSNVQMANGNSELANYIKGLLK